MRLPRRLDFGLAIVSVKLVSKARMAEIAECDEGEDPPDGYWEPDDDAIYIQRAMSNDRKRSAFWHEIVHAVNDTDYWTRYG